MSKAQLRRLGLLPIEVPGRFAALAARRTNGFINFAHHAKVAWSGPAIEQAIKSAYLQGIEDVVAVMEQRGKRSI